MQPSWDSMAATSTCQRSRIASLSARSLTCCLMRVARPKESGFASESTSTNVLMLPCSVSSSRTRSAVMRRCCSTAAADRGEEVGRRAWLGQKSKDLTLVDRRDRRVEIGLAGQKEPDGVGGELAAAGQEHRPIHAGHPHVGEDRRERAASSNQMQPGNTARCRLYLVLAAKMQGQAFENPGLVVHAEYPGTGVVAHRSHPLGCRPQWTRHSLAASRLAFR